MYPQSFLSARKPKPSNVLPQRNNYVKSVRKQYGNPDSQLFNKYVHRTFHNYSSKQTEVYIFHETSPINKHVD